jgi:UDP-N-acetylmuramoyl-L-alanyl-D-glutamate--2,6-diaminopimelate ligase
MKQLSDILKGIRTHQVLGESDKAIAGIVLDSRKIVEGSVFVASKGTLADGHHFIPQAIVQGAAAIVCEILPDEIHPKITYIQVDNSAQALGMLASNFYDHPSSKLKLVGVTGTNGKTTIATLLYQLFRELGYKCGLLSTVQNYINERIIPATHTTPDAIILNTLLNEMVETGCDYCFMEVSSHAVAQHRIAGLDFTGGVFSNITHDHLDFHHTFDNYLKAKKAFFDALPKNAFALTNVDDKNGKVMLQNTKAHQKTYGLKNMADYKARILENHFSGLLLDIDTEEVWFTMIGSFNAYNLLAAYATAMLLDQDKATVLTTLSRLKGAAGRFDYVIAPNQVIGIVDYAHTPDAVKNVLTTIQDIRKGSEQVITVIGCGGDRDKTKRPEMARMACEWSDKVILTSDNPRSEDPEVIIAEMAQGVKADQKRKVLTIVDRNEAIKTACHLAKPGDIVLIAGKGHEKYQEIKGIKTPFDDKDVIRKQFELMS